MSWGKFWDVSSSTELKILAITPANNATATAVPAPIVVSFDRDIDSSSVTTTTSGASCSGTFQVSTDSFATCLAGTISFSSTKQLTFTPTSAFCVESQYAVQVKVVSGIKSTDGRGISSYPSASTSFSTQQALLKIQVTAGTSVYALQIACNTLFVGGAFTTVAGVARSNIFAVDLTTGNLSSHSAANLTANGAVNALALDGQTLYAGGAFANVGASVPRLNLASFDVTTGAVSSWDPSANSIINAFTIADSALFVAGNFTNITSCGGRNRLAKFSLATGACDLTWNANSTIATVSTLVGSGSTLYVGGSFTGGTVGGVARNYMVSVSTTGTGAGNSGFCTVATNGTVSALAAFGSKVFAGGAFGPGLCGTTYYSFGAVDGTSGANFGFASGAGTGANNTVTAMNASSTRVYIGGAFNGGGSFVSALRNYAGATDHLGALSSWDPNLNASVKVIANVGSAVFIGGDFGAVNGAVPANRITLVDATTGIVRQ